MDNTNYKLLGNDSTLSHKQVLSYLAVRHLDLSLGIRAPSLEEICNTMEYYNELDSTETI